MVLLLCWNHRYVTYVIFEILLFTSMRSSDQYIQLALGINPIRIQGLEPLLPLGIANRTSDEAIAFCVYSTTVDFNVEGILD